MGATTGSAGGNSAKGNLGYAAQEGRSDLIGWQTSVIGASGVNIYTENNTHLKGAIIAALNNNLTLNTGTLSYEDMTGRRTSTELSVGLAAGYKWNSGGKTGDASAPKADAGSGGTGVPGQAKDVSYRPEWWKNLMDRRDAAANEWKSFKEAAIVAPGAFSYGHSATEQKARATVGPGKTGRG
jgi:filamentous hemagglutinin